MSNTGGVLRTLAEEQLDFDRKGIELAILFTVVLTVTALLALQLRGFSSAVQPPASFGEGTTGQATAAATWAVAEVLFAGVLLLAIFGIRKLPSWARTTVRRSILILGLVYVGGTAGTAAVAMQVGAVLVAVYALYRITDHYGLWWVPNNLMSLVAAIWLGIVLGFLFGAVGVGIAAVILLVYDHYFANKKEWMFQLVGPMLRYRLPVLFVRPSQLRFEWMNLLSDDEDDRSDVIEWGVGTADIAIPAGFVTGVAVDPNGIIATFGEAVLVLFVLAVALACFRLSWRLNTHGNGAGLPPLTVALIVPYLLLVVLVSL